MDRTSIPELLLEDAPEFLFWLGGAALAGATIVGIR